MCPALQAAKSFNQSLSWDVSSVTNMRIMFLVRCSPRALAPYITTARPPCDSRQFANSLSAANKLLIRCVWAGNPAFASAGYGSSWAPGSCP